MSQIQIDMFEVQLGAALLLQFKLMDGSIVRVLADAGVDKGSNYQITHVYNKLFDARGNPTDVWLEPTDELKIDLIIGTHYDADHLLGLIPIIEDTRLNIDEIWLPPVQDDVGVLSTQKIANDDFSLVKRLMSDSDDSVLKNYLLRRLEVINEIPKNYPRESKMYERVVNPSGYNLEGYNFDFDFAKKNLNNPETLSDLIRFFEIHKSQATVSLASEHDGTHACDDDDEDEAFLNSIQKIKASAYSSDGFYSNYSYLKRALLSSYRPNLDLNDESIFMAHHTALQSIRKSAANEGINAANLAKVIMAIKARHAKGGSKIRIVSEGIHQGEPKYFKWNGNRFLEANPNSQTELGFHLMGPSYELIAKLHDKLPIGTYLLAYHSDNLRSGTVTPSNRLSYVLRFQFLNQAILVTGDAGFSDFAPDRTSNFYPKLLNLLERLHVVQVAHHGGNNHMFYQALDASRLTEQNEWVLLLLSHAVDDKTRPRKEFRSFVARFRHDGVDNVSVLFTSRPRLDNVDTIIDLIHPLEPSSIGAADKGDVRLSFPCEAGTAEWRVINHFIQV